MVIPFIFFIKYVYYGYIMLLCYRLYCLLWNLITSSLYLFFTFFVRRRAVNPPALARDDWKIVRALSEVIYMHVYIIFLRNLFFNTI